MAQLLVLGAKALLAGAFVALISRLSTALKPRMFAGLFAAAPSVAAASLVVDSLDKPATVAPRAEGMIGGTAGMCACCLVAMVLVPRLHSLAASAAGWLAWAGAALATCLVTWR